MDQSSGRTPPGELGYGAWLLFWGEVIVLSLCVVLGVWFASVDAAPGDDVCGLILAVAAILLVFLLLKQRFDGADAGLTRFAPADTMAGLVLVIVVFAVLALGGLFVAADVNHGGLHNAGVAMFAVSVLAILVSIKGVFDALEGRR